MESEITRSFRLVHTGAKNQMYVFRMWDKFWVTFTAGSTSLISSGVYLSNLLLAIQNLNTQPSL
jgi:hypothetical protein